MKNINKLLLTTGIFAGTLGIFGNVKGQEDHSNKSIDELTNTFLIPFQDDNKGKLIYLKMEPRQINGNIFNRSLKYKENIPYINSQGEKDSCNMLLLCERGQNPLIFIDTKNKTNLSEKISGKAKYKVDKVEYAIECEIVSEKIVPKKQLQDDPYLQNYSTLYSSAISIIQREDDIKNGRGVVMEGIYIKK